MSQTRSETKHTGSSIETCDGDPVLLLPGDNEFLPGTIFIGDERLAIGPTYKDVYKDGSLIEVTKRPFEVVRLLAENLDSFISLPQITRTIWGYYDDSVVQTLRVTASSFRNSLHDYELSDTKNGVIQYWSEIGYVALSSLKGKKHIWDEDKHVTFQIVPGKVEYNFSTHHLRVNGTLIELTPEINKLVGCLINNRETSLSTDTLCMMLNSGHKENDTELSLDATRTRIASLRRLLGEEFGHPKNGIILRDHFGYRISTPD